MMFSTAVLALLAGTASASSILVTYDAAGSQAPANSICSDCYLSFDSLNNGAQNYSAQFGSTGVTGSYTNLNIVSANQYGGAGGTGKYAEVGVQSGTTSYSLALSKQVNYFGLWWSAGDAQNDLQFYSGGTLISSFSTADMISLVGNCSNPSGNAFCGNPNSSGRAQDNGEPFAYLNFFGQNGTSFDRVVFANNTTGTGFESDNHAVAILNGSTTTGTPVTTLTGAPEPSTFLLLLIAPCFLVARKYLGKRTA